MSNNIQELRLAFLLSPREFARLIGVYPDYVSRLESGERPLTDLWIDAIAKALDVPRAMITDPDAKIDAKACHAHRPTITAPVLCPIAARYGVLALVAKMGGLRRAEALDEDKLADAVQNLVAYVDDRTPGLPGEHKEDVRANRLLKGLQITALTILQSCEADLPEDFHRQLEIAARGAHALLEAFSNVDETAQLPGI
ncbi:helix-turn-helix domain-containing protein [Hyphococcus sp.]|uniref:helix-turn-helix domain-containing protein n=1 Tax=Hyphococcus sp. TaxID=2038636 RepID=UPI003CCBAD2D